MEKQYAQSILAKRTIITLDVNNPSHSELIIEKPVKITSVGEPTDKSSWIVNLNAINLWQVEQIQEALAKDDFEKAANFNLTYNVRRDEDGTTKGWLPTANSFIKAQFAITESLQEDGTYEPRVRCVAIMPLSATSLGHKTGKDVFSSFLGAKVEKAAETTIGEEHDDEIVQESVTTQKTTKKQKA